MHTPNAALRSPIVVLLLTVWLAVCLPVYGQQTSSAPSTQALPDPKTKLTGYLVWKSDKVYLQTADSKKLFLLSGNIATLEEFEGCQLTLTGKITNDTANNGASNSLPIFEVSRIAKSSAKHLPKLDASFENTATWVTERNNLNGIKFAHPTIVVFERSPDPSYSGASNFASDENVEKIVGLDIPDTAYPATNFRGGSFTIYVSHALTNRQSCMQFGESWARGGWPPFYAIGHVTYSRSERGGAAMGTESSGYQFHTFQNGQCYQLSFTLLEVSTGNYDQPCNIPALSDADEFKLIQPLIASVSYFSPSLKPKRATDTRATPTVTEFTASSLTADSLNDHGRIHLSWRTANADYVAFSYLCPGLTDPLETGTVIFEGDAYPNCRNAAPFLTKDMETIYHSPNSSLKFLFASSDHDDSIRIIVTITPFSHGQGYPAASKSLTITVNPKNQFPGGIPTATRNMTIGYEPAPEGSTNYSQGSALVIKWTDERGNDPCVNLYLAQDTADGTKYVTQINGRPGIPCLTPASRGSFVWTIPKRLSGSGFRIFASTPGGSSQVLGKPFTIVKEDLTAN